MSTEETPKKRRGILSNLLLLLALFGGIASLVAIKGAQFNTLMASAEAASAYGPTSVDAVEVKAETVEGIFQTVGTVVARRSVSLSAPVPGHITHLPFTSGSAVKRGDIVARLDTRVERAQLSRAKAALRQAEQTLKRHQPLRESGAIATNLIETQENARDTALANLSEARARIELKTIRAPFSGKIGIQQVLEGQFVNPGVAIITLQAPDQTWVDFPLPQRHLHAMKVGAHVDLSWPGATKPIQGTVATISPQVDPNTRAATIRLEVPTGNTPLRPGMYTNIRWAHSTRTLPVIPTSAVLRGKGYDKVFVLSTEGDALLARERRVRTVSTEHETLAVEEGIQPGDRVVTAGAFKLYDGARIAVTADTSQGGAP